jgi:hypothetical protein
MPKPGAGYTAQTYKMGNFWEENQVEQKGGGEYQVGLNFIHPWWKVLGIRDFFFTPDPAFLSKKIRS